MATAQRRVLKIGSTLDVNNATIDPLVSTNGLYIARRCEGDSCHFKDTTRGGPSKVYNTTNFCNIGSKVECVLLHRKEGQGDSCNAWWITDPFLDPLVQMDASMLVFVGGGGVSIGLSRYVWLAIVLCMLECHPTIIAPSTSWSGAIGGNHVVGWHFGLPAHSLGSLNLINRKGC